LHLETTADLPENADVPDILEALAAILADQDSVEPRKVRAYHSLRSVWVMGEGGPAGFAHLTGYVARGRSVEWRAGLSKQLAEVLKEHFGGSLTEKGAAVSVEIREIEPESYIRLE